MIKIFDEKGEELQYTKIEYPDSQQSVELVTLPKKPNYLIAARLSDFRQVELLLAVVAAIKAVTPSCKITLNVVYLLGGRSDRQFSKNSPNYLRDVISPVINQLNLTQVRILDPHSDVTEAVFKKARPWSILPVLLDRYLNDKMIQTSTPVQIVVPDAGAEKRIASAISSWRQDDVNNQIQEFRFIQFIKNRDKTTGKIVGMTLCQNQEVDFDLPTVVIDDLCDGGRTFLEIAEKVVVRDLDLIVTHGIFSKGINPLLAEYNTIYTTNSYKDFEDQPDVDVYKVI